MLRRLTVRNLAIVEDLELELDQGLTVITGETGAGKSILVDALALLVCPGYFESCAALSMFPNFVLVIGQIDDAVVVTWALRYACRRLPTEMLEAAWTGDPDTLDRLLGRPRS